MLSPINIDTKPCLTRNTRTHMTSHLRSKSERSWDWQLQRKDNGRRSALVNNYRKNKERRIDLRRTKVRRQPGERERERSTRGFVERFSAQCWTFLFISCSSTEPLNIRHTRIFCDCPPNSWPLDAENDHPFFSCPGSTFSAVYWPKLFEIDLYNFCGGFWEPTQLPLGLSVESCVLQNLDKFESRSSLSLGVVWPLSRAHAPRCR